MKQLVYKIIDTYDLTRYVNNLAKQEYYTSAAGVVVHMYTERNDPDYIDYVRRHILVALPKARFVGMTSVAEIRCAQLCRDTSLLTFQFFRSSEVTVIEYDLSGKNLYEAIDDFDNRLAKFTDLQGIQLYTTSLSVDANTFLTALQNLNPSVPVFGAGAGMHGFIRHHHKLLVFGEQTYESGMVLICYHGPHLRILTDDALGWHPIGREMQITATDGLHIIKELDEWPIIDAYRRYLGVTSGDRFLENTQEFPLMLRRGSRWIARVAYRYDPNIGVMFTADVHKGEKIMFSYGSKRAILEEVDSLAHTFRLFKPQGMMLSICQTRPGYLKEDSARDFTAFSGLETPIAGCYAFSEILFHQESGGVLNSAVVAVGFREISPNKYEDIRAIDHVLELQASFRQQMDYPNAESYEERFCSITPSNTVIPFEERIISFLNATTGDLMLAYKRMEEQATIDGLTQIYNRKRISSILEYEMSKRNIAGTLCIVMFDIDFFKRVNDTYGHDMGDTVLRKLADTVKHCIRPQDSLGRWGGEEFMVLLPATQKEEATMIAERIRTNANAIIWENMPSISISVGVACVRESDDFTAFYNRVDARLYMAKKTGRNKVVSEDIPVPEGSEAARH